MSWVLVLIAGWLAATVSGVAGFGGALLLLPILTWILGPKAAIPVLTIAQLMGNASRAAFGFREIAWRPVLFFALGALPASLLGATWFVRLPGPMVMQGVGVFLLLVIGLRHSRHGSGTIPGRALLPAGALVGLISALVGSAGPLGAAVFLGLRLAPTAYVASEAVTATCMHLVKTLTYGSLMGISPQGLAAGLSLGAAMVFGSWTGRRMIERVPKKWLGYFVEVLLAASAIALIRLA